MRAGLSAGTTAIATVLTALASGALAAGTTDARHSASPHADDIVISVPGIPGPYCAYGAEKRLLDVPGVSRVETRWRDERIVVMLAPGAVVQMPEIHRAMERSEYPYHYVIANAP
ncbi:MAG: hypothetical protein NVS4B3_13710 [Gemmatimonadaceae bacterium]